MLVLYDPQNPNQSEIDWKHLTHNDLAILVIIVGILTIFAIIYFVKQVKMKKHKKESSSNDIGLHIIKRQSESINLSNYPKEDSKESRVEESEEVDIKSDYIKDISSDGSLYYGTFFFPYLNQKLGVFFSCNTRLSYAENVIKYIQTMDNNSFKDAISGMVSFYNDFLKTYGCLWNDMPIRIDENNLLNYVKIDSLFICEPEGSSKIGFSLNYKCPCIEGSDDDNLTCAFIEDKSVFVGSSDGFVNPFSKFHETNKYNYSLMYHDKVTLTEQEYQKIENDFSSN